MAAKFRVNFLGRISLSNHHYAASSNGASSHFFIAQPLMRITAVQNGLGSSLTEFGLSWKDDRALAVEWAGDLPEIPEMPTVRSGNA
jgi:hypothetical protein